MSDSFDERSGRRNDERALTRRDMLQASVLVGAGLAAGTGVAGAPGAAGGGAAGGTAIAPGAIGSKGSKGLDGINQRQDGTYETVPLRKDVVTISLCQTRVRAVDAKNPKPGLRDNLRHMLNMIDAAQGSMFGPKDLLFFHEFPITGYSNRWDRADALRLAIEVPGEETEEISKKARQYGCYIVFGTYARDKDWPNHLLSLTNIIGPGGEIVGRSWKARNIKGLWPNFELFTSTIHDNLDQFVEMYGWDKVVPVYRTDIGNITTTSTQREPELPRAAAMKGCELFLRTATGGFSRADVEATAIYNNMYSCVVNNAVSRDNPGFFASDDNFGGSCIYDPQGRLIAQAGPDNEEQEVVGRLPMAELRRRKRQPVVHMELWKPMFDRYVGRYPANLFKDTMPANGQEAFAYLRDKARWK
ncbi:MAG: nitrilase-related carbon-nitrogen hydrolase [Pseudomonadota bacterium]